MIRNWSDMAGHPVGEPLSLGVSAQAEIVVTRVCIPELPFEEVRIVRRADGRHVRLGNGRRNRAVGRYASVKVGASVPWESRLELDDIRRAEVDPNVLAYVAQPETLHWVFEGKARQYTPDRFDQMADGSTCVIEIKDEFDRSEDPTYTAKLDQASEIYQALGRDFSLRDRMVIRAEPEFSAIEEVQTYRRAVVTVEHVEWIHSELSPGGMPLDQLIRSRDQLLSRPVIFAMMVQRIVCVELKRGLLTTSMVTLVTDQP